MTVARGVPLQITEATRQTYIIYRKFKRLSVAVRPLLAFGKWQIEKQKQTANTLRQEAQIQLPWGSSTWRFIFHPERATGPFGPQQVHVHLAGPKKVPLCGKKPSLL